MNASRQPGYRAGQNDDVNQILSDIIPIELLDASQYAHYVFKTFKNGNSGTIKFEVITIDPFQEPTKQYCLEDARLSRLSRCRKAPCRPIDLGSLRVQPLLLYSTFFIRLPMDDDCPPDPVFPSSSSIIAKTRKMKRARHHSVLFKWPQKIPRDLSSGHLNVPQSLVDSSSSTDSLITREGVDFP